MDCDLDNSFEGRLGWIRERIGCLGRLSSFLFFFCEKRTSMSVRMRGQSLFSVTPSTLMPPKRTGKRFSSREAVGKRGVKPWLFFEQKYITRFIPIDFQNPRTPPFLLLLLLLLLLLFHE